MKSTFNQLCRVFRQVPVEGGLLVLKGKIVQAVWNCDALGRKFESPEVETWVNQNAREARQNFVSMAYRYGTS